MLDRSHLVLFALVPACRIPDIAFTPVTDGSGAPVMDGSDAPVTDGSVPCISGAMLSVRSCTGLPATCGETGDANCCDSPCVPGGMYYRGYDLAADQRDKDRSFPATVSTFRLDKYEVTVGRFRAFVNLGMGTQQSPPMRGDGAHPNLAGSGWDMDWNSSLMVDTTGLTNALKCAPTFQTWIDPPDTPVDESRPINCVSWYEAMAFCAWDGGYLPTEAEWNYAAAGGGLQRPFPWSDRLDLGSEFASYSDAKDNCVGDGMDGCAVTDLVVVGSKPMGNGLWGQSDLGGNVNEWVLDSTLDQATSYPDPCRDCAQLTFTPTSNRVSRGGDFHADQSRMRTGMRDWNPPATRDQSGGFRCARAP